MSGWGILVLAASALALETALLRVFALTQGYHFAFMAVSVALLGMGGGGTLLALAPPSWRRPGRGEGILAWTGAAFALSTAGGYALAVRLPLDVYRIAWERLQVVYLALYYVLLALPFVWSGLAMGLALEIAPAAHAVYAANLVGSAAGCLVGLGALSILGGPGTVALSAGGGCAAATLFACRTPGRTRRWRSALAIGGSLGAACFLGLAWFDPAWLQATLSPYRPLSQALQFPGARVLDSRWNAFSRVDVVDSSAIHVSPGLSLQYTGEGPRQRGLYVDAHAQAAITVGGAEQIRAWSDHLPLALAYHLRPEANVLVLEPGGGLDVAAARALGASTVTAVSSNPLAIDAVRRYGGDLYRDPAVRVVAQSPRSYVRRCASAWAGETEPVRFDLIDVALNDAQQVVVSGAFALSEEYRYTVPALADDLALLAPEGLLVVQRWLQTPPSESLRAWALAVEALERHGDVQPADSLAAIRSWSTMLILVKNGTFAPSELAVIRRFCAQRGFDLVYLPDLLPEEVNRYNVYPGAPYFVAFGDLLRAEPRRAFYRAWPYDVRPPSDDRPYFFHFFKWRQVRELWQALGHTWQPFGGGGYLVLLALLGVALVASAVLIALPAALASRQEGERLGQARLEEVPLSQAREAPVLAYFGCLGIAYLAVEIPLIQRLVLLLDHPTHAFALVAGVLLVASGGGSLLAGRLRARWAMPALVLYLLLLVLVLRPFSDLALGWPLVARAALSAVLLAPLGLLMGVPFPAGVALLRRRAPGLVPWAWGVNGCASVVTSISAALIALAWGFNAVLGLAGAAYLVSWGLLRGMEEQG